MNQISTLDKVNKNFAGLSEQDLMETEGGFVITLTTGAVIGIGLAVTGLGAGYYFGRK
ncbi:hypothetical protein HO966_09300 [Streptococcus suis]|uniref:hypothetical protein n=1 Tax=Streptococcus suis TaxID=1307 RepID=UPI001557A4EC|nr:hypothetical protein [Streptococcus suis]HEM3195777.1 hypothetical protein [Streptococcus suis 10581]MBY4978367.1 hypothetical protein [Streptococcus suis]MBY4978414.1 hypothetical protein [Streptococcus suis]NQG19997.1 hypothetical protein [Streptococcus suis]NQG19999.1 hypothetical protein [Streptococcus suis]